MKLYGQQKGKIDEKLTEEMTMCSNIKRDRMGCILKPKESPSD
jgi:hypothetical protein